MKIFDPQAKIVANSDRVLELFKTGNTAPVLVEVDPSNACNHSCKFCLSAYIHFSEYKGTNTFSRDIMSRDALLSLCKDFVDMKVKAVNWTGGGEPTVNKHLKEAITFLGKSGIKMGMFTNGTLLDKHDLFQTLVDNMTWVRFSVDAGTQQTYDSVRKASKTQNWGKMNQNLQTLIEHNTDKQIDIGVGFVITPDTYHEIIDFAKHFSSFDVSYCQFKPEIIIREKGGVQREVDFWNNKVKPALKEAKSILGDKFKINAYKLDDLTEDPEAYGRTYKKCLGSQLSPCVGADGHVYVCTNHRGWKEYSYGSIYDRTFKDIWNDISTRRKVMSNIEEVECFKHCTKLCKPHESNKKMWELYKQYASGELKEEKLLQESEEVRKHLRHIEFI